MTYASCPTSVVNTPAGIFRGEQGTSERPDQSKSRVLFYITVTLSAVSPPWQLRQRPRRGVQVPLPRRRAPHFLAFCYGSALGAFPQGVVSAPSSRASDRRAPLSGGSVDCFTPFSLVTGVALVFGYALLGAGWLILKTEGPLQDWARGLGRAALAGVIIAIVVVSLWTPLQQPEIADAGSPGRTSRSCRRCRS